MPSKEQHIKVYAKNKNLANEKLFLNENLEWRVTFIFYAAMHLLDSSVAEKGCHFTSHIARNSFLQKNKLYDSIIDEYEFLEVLSRKARYDCISIKQRDVNLARESLEVLEGSLL